MIRVQKNLSLICEACGGTIRQSPEDLRVCGRCGGNLRVVTPAVEQPHPMESQQVTDLETKF